MAKKETKEEVQDVAVVETAVETVAEVQEQPVKEEPKKELSLKERDPEASAATPFTSEPEGRIVEKS